MAAKSIWGTSVKDSLAYLRAILALYKVGTVIDDRHFKEDLLEVFKNHPYKTALPPCEVVVTHNQQYGKQSKCFGIIDSTQELILFSIQNVAVKPFNLSAEIAKIFRFYVSNDLQQKKERLIEQYGLICMKDKVSCDRSSLTLNHDHPYEFNKIVETFLRSNSIVLNENLLELSSNQQLVFKDTSLLEKFRVYHKTFLNDGYVSLLSKSNNSKLGTSHRFKPMLIEKPNFNSAHTWQKSQLSLFDGVADGV